MIVIGAGGFAKELIDILEVKSNYSDKNLFFYDDINHTPDSLYGFKILHDLNEAEYVFNEISTDFCIGVGSPKYRYLLCNKFENLGGSLKSVISPASTITRYNVEIGLGTCIMNNSSISNEVKIGKGTLINSQVLVAHDVKIGDFCDIAPGVKLSGHCQIGKYVSISTGAIILPKVKIGQNSFIGAGSVITTDVPENSVVIGIVQSRVVNKLTSFEKGL